MRLSFAKGPYGPYADDLRKSLRDMERHVICGFGDGTSRPLEGQPLIDDASARGEFEGVVELVAGFEIDYGLELLASVHWAAAHEGAASPREAGETVRAWTTCKAIIFTQPHVATAWDALHAGNGSASLRYLWAESAGAGPIRRSIGEVPHERRTDTGAACRRRRRHDRSAFLAMVRAPRRRQVARLARSRRRS